MFLCMGARISVFLCVCMCACACVCECLYQCTSIYVRIIQACVRTSAVKFIYMCIYALICVAVITRPLPRPVIRGAQKNEED